MLFGGRWITCLGGYVWDEETHFPLLRGFYMNKCLFPANTMMSICPKFSIAATSVEHAYYASNSRPSSIGDFWVPQQCLLTWKQSWVIHVLLQGQSSRPLAHLQSLVYDLIPKVYGAAKRHCFFFVESNSYSGKGQNFHCCKNIKWVCSTVFLSTVVLKVPCVCLIVPFQFHRKHPRITYGCPQVLYGQWSQTQQ